MDFPIPSLQAEAFQEWDDSMQNVQDFTYLTYLLDPVFQDKPYKIGKWRSSYVIYI